MKATQVVLGLKPLNDTDDGSATTPLLGKGGERTAVDMAMTRRINFKMDLALLPLLSLLYLFNGLDRGNIGNAQTQGNDAPPARVLGGL